MKHALLFGCGSNWGAEFTKYLADCDYQVTLITSSQFEYKNVKSHTIDWPSLTLNDIINFTINEKYNLIFFNHNMGGCPNEIHYAPNHEVPIDHWNNSIWIYNQLPYYTIHSLQNNIDKDTKIGWMLSGIIKTRDPEYFRYGGYASHKAMNFFIMQGFSRYFPGIFFAIEPGTLNEKNYKEDSETIYRIIDNLEESDNGKAFSKNGNVWQV